MAIHNDIFLALLAPFYFIYESPATLLVIQALILGLGAFAVYKITQRVFVKNKYKNQFSLMFSLGYLLYPPLQLANIFEFHSVTLATTFLLFMFYFWLIKRYRWSFIFFVLALLTKEQVALTTGFFGAYVLYSRFKPKNDSEKRFALTLTATSAIWFLISVFVIIPYFRGGNEHFALKYFDWIKENPLFAIFKVATNPKTYSYLFNLLGPLGFLSLLSPLQLLIALPEFTINLFSKNPNLRNIIYHYTAVITPFVFISVIYGAQKLIKRIGERNSLSYLLLFVFLFAVLVGPLPFSKRKNIHPFAYPQKEGLYIRQWAKRLNDDQLKVSSTGQLSPHLTSRRYFYTFSKYYENAEYVVIRLNEIYNYPEKAELIPVYEKMILDPYFVQIERKENFEVYKNIGN